MRPTGLFCQIRRVRDRETGHREHENEKRLHQSSQSWRQTGSHLPRVARIEVADHWWTMSIGNRLALATSADPGRSWYIAASGFGLGLLLITHLLVQGRVAAEQTARRISVELNERRRGRWLESERKALAGNSRHHAGVPLAVDDGRVRTTDCGHICRLIRATRFPSAPLLVSISL